MSGLLARTVDETAALEALEPGWWDLWLRCRASPFQSPAWLLPWWRTFGPGPLRTVAVSAGDRLVGLAPLYLEHGAHGRRLLPLGISLSDQFDLLLDPGCEAEVGAAVLRHLVEAHGPEWDVLSLEECPPDAAALRLQAPPGWQDGAAPQSACPGLDFGRGADADGLPLDLPGKRRQNVRRAQRACEGLVIEAVSDGPVFLTTLSRLHARRWQTCDGSEGVLADSQVQAFQAAALPGLLRAGLARCWTARLGADIAAAYYGLVWDDQAAFYLSGFDPGYVAKSPLTVLIAHAMADALREGGRHFSFLRGQEGYKYLWGASDRWNQRRVLSRPKGDRSS